MNLLSRLRVPNPIWIDENGHCYFQMSEIETTHLINIVKFIEDIILPRLNDEYENAGHFSTASLPEDEVPGEMDWFFEDKDKEIRKSKRLIKRFNREIKQREKKGWSF